MSQQQTEEIRIDIQTLQRQIEDYQTEIFTLNNLLNTDVSNWREDYRRKYDSDYKN
ncbi:hypothetical protein HDU92_008487, partial [Lobulomyces angularis]